MTDSRMTDAAQSEAVDAAQPLVAPAGLNLLSEESAGGCCGGGSCAMPGE